MNRRDLSLDKYGISKHMYRELYSFCRQYAEKKATIRAARLYRGSRLSGVPGAPGPSDPTFAAAAASEKAKRDVDLIERVARAATEGKAAYAALLLNVTAGVPYERLIVPMGRNQFFAARRKFFWLLARERSMI